MRNRKYLIGILFIVTAVILAACGNNSEMNHDENDENTEMYKTDSHDGMKHSSSGEVPENLAVAENPKYDVGDQAILKTDHLEGM